MSHDNFPGFGDKVVPFHRREPTNVHLITYWQIASALTGRPITCAGFRAVGGFELRVQYSEREVIEAQLFRGPGAWRRMEAYSIEARHTMHRMGMIGPARHLREEA